jgi:phage-related protein
MFEIVFYATESGKQPVRQFLLSLRHKKDKHSINERKKIAEYIQNLLNYGTQIGEPYVKKIDGDLWELRPLHNRIFFFCWTGTKFVFLHHFVKKTKKTPPKEIEYANRNMRNYIRGEKNEK